MRKPRDIDAELKTLADKQRLLKSRRIVQLGELVVATGADTLDIETLAGVLIDAVARPKSDPAREAWRTSGAAFFRSERRAAGGINTRSSSAPTGAAGNAGSAKPDGDGA